MSTARHNVYRGAMLLSCAALVMAVLNALQKTSGKRLSVVEILFFRNLFSIPFVMIVAARSSIVLRTQHFRGHVARSVVGLISMGMVVVTVTHIPLAEQQVLAYTQPLFLVLLSSTLLGERPGIQRIVSVLIGFAGVITVALGGGATHPSEQTVPGWAVALALAQGGVGALTVIQVRQLTATEKSTTIAMWQAILMTLFAAMGLPFVWVTPTLTDGLCLIVVGACAGTAQLLSAEAFASAQISSIGPFTYSGLIWTALIGWMVFDERPKITLAIGGFLVVAAGIWMLVTERRPQSRR